MAANVEVDYYEILQVSDSAELETINRVYRIFAQRYHPDNRETGNEARFREITEAYHVLSNPERRAQYDATNQKRRKERWRLVSSAASRAAVAFALAAMALSLAAMAASLLAVTCCSIALSVRHAANPVSPATTIRNQSAGVVPRLKARA